MTNALEYAYVPLHIVKAVKAAAASLGPDDDDEEEDDIDDSDLE